MTAKQQQQDDTKLQMQLGVTSTNHVRQHLMPDSQTSYYQLAQSCCSTCEVAQVAATHTGAGRMHNTSSFPVSIWVSAVLPEIQTNSPQHIQGQLCYTAAERKIDEQCLPRSQ